jgi:hypothetical protein
MGWDSSTTGAAHPGHKRHAVQCTRPAGSRELVSVAVRRLYDGRMCLEMLPVEERDRSTV